MMAFNKLLNVFAMTTALLLVGTTMRTVEACDCEDLDVCGRFDAADVVLLGTVLSRSNRRGGRRRSRRTSSVTYTVELTTLYKGDPDVGDAQEVTFTTERHSSKCGVYLEVGEEYLIGLDQKNDDGDLTANSCGLVEEWSSVSDEDKASVEDACEDDLCNGACSEFMECLTFNEVGYCADVCEPSPCAEDEICTLEQLIVCIVAPCPPQAVCTAAPTV
eukprot:jgi/Undpi1/5264/HiC_scaffold_2.g00545.m1